MTLTDTRGIDVGHAAPEVCIRTYPSMTYFNLIEPCEEDVHIADIAHHLSMLNRFVGGTPRPYSVGEHTLLVSNLLERRHGENWLSLAGLGHDASEAYAGDVSGLLKRTDELSGYREVEHRISRVIEKRMGLPRNAFEDHRVKQADKDAFEFECSAVRDAPWRVAPDPSTVEREWVSRYLRLGGPKWAS